VADHWRRCLPTARTTSDAPTDLEVGSRLEFSVHVFTFAVSVRRALTDQTGARLWHTGNAVPAPRRPGGDDTDAQMKKNPGGA